MIHFRTEDTVARNPEEVWTFANDVARWPDWIDVENPQVLAGRADQAGGRVRMDMKALGRKFPFLIEIAAAEPARRVVWQIVDGRPLRGRYVLELEPLGASSTRVRYAGDLSLTGWRRLIEPIVQMEVRKGEARQLQRMKAILESAPEPAAVRA